MFGFSNRQLLLLSLIINLILLLSTLHGSLDLTTVSKDELHSWSQLANERLDQFTQQASRHTAANVVRAPKCDMCSAAPELCKEMGKNRMAQALSYAGSNQRLRRVLKKMRSGEPWTLGVIGGSVSKGHGVAHGNDNNKPYRNLHRKPCMHRIIFDHLDTLFPSRHPQVAQSLEEAAEKKAKNPKWITPLVDIAAVEKGLEFDPAEIKEPISRAYGFSAKSLGVNSFVNGAQGATGSDYFGFCFGEHIPQDVDLVLVELGINDERQLKTLDNYEIMLRGLLDMPNKPAVLYIEVFQMMFSTMGFGADLHRGINEYYDIPSVSLRNPFLPQALAHSELVPGMFIPDKNMAGPINGVDTRHLSNDFHNITAQLVNAYIDSQLCEMDQEGDVDYEEDPIPRQTLGSQWDLDVNLPPLKPTCKSLASIKNKLTPITSEGWEEWAWKEKKYIIAKKPGSKITFPVSTTLGTVQLIYQRAYAYGLGKVRCGLVGVASTDTVLDGYWSLPYNILQTHTMRNIPPGDYTMKCELLPQTSDPDGGTEFRIASITSI